MLTNSLWPGHCTSHTSRHYLVCLGHPLALSANISSDGVPDFVYKGPCYAPGDPHARISSHSPLLGVAAPRNHTYTDCSTQFIHNPHIVRTNNSTSWRPRNASSGKRQILWYLWQLGKCGVTLGASHPLTQQHSTGAAISQRTRRLSDAMK